MKYSEWNTLSGDERKAVAWHRHPRVRTATLFIIAFGIAFIIVVLGISKNSTVHLNRKPTGKEAFSIAKVFVKDKLKQPDAAVFPNTNYQTLVDTTADNYQVSSSVKMENTSGKMMPSNWVVKMHYTGGDWADRNSWQLTSIVIKP